MYSYPYLMNNGFKLYKDIINPYTPLLNIILSFYFKLLPITLNNLKIITYVVIIIIDAFLIRSFSTLKLNIRLTLILIFIFWQLILEGNGLWFDLSITPLAIFSFLIVMKPEKKFNLKTIYFLGFTLGSMFLMKQTSIFYTIACGLILLRYKYKQRLVKIFGFLMVGFITPLIIITSYFIANGTVNEYIYWAYIYPYKHLASKGFLLIPTYKQVIVSAFLISPLIITLRHFKNKVIQSLTFFILASLIFSVPRFSYFHLQPLLPFIILLLGYTLKILPNTTKLKIYYFVYLFLTLVLFTYYGKQMFGQEPRFINTKTKLTASEIVKNLPVKNNILFYNLSSEYFFSSGLLPLKPWADTFPWYLENTGLQDKILLSMEQNKPIYIIYRRFGNQGKYIPGSYIPEKIDNFIKNNFKDYVQINNDISILK